MQFSERLKYRDNTAQAAPQPAYHADERGAGSVGNGLGHHGLPGPGGPVHEDASGRVNADLLVQLEVRQRELDRLLNLHTRLEQAGGEEG